MTIATGDPWDEIRGWLNTPQRLRFAGRTYRALEARVPELVASFQGAYPLGLRQRQSLPLLPFLQRRYDGREPAPRFLALLGGPGAGKSFTAWKLYEHLEQNKRPQGLRPFYISLAYTPVGGLLVGQPQATLYDVVCDIAQHINFPAPLSLLPPDDEPHLFILDDASLLCPAEGLAVLINNHRKYHSKDHLLVLLYDTQLLYPQEPDARSLRLSEDELFLSSCGFAPSAGERWPHDDRLMFKIEGDTSGWPLVIETYHRYHQQLDNKSWYHFHQDLVAQSLVRAPPSPLDYNSLARLMKNAQTAPLLRIPPEEVARTNLLNELTTTVPMGHSYPHNDVYTYNQELGLVFANSLCYASILAGTLDPRKQLAKWLSDPYTTVLDLEDIQASLPANNHVLADLLFAACLSRLLHDSDAVEATAMADARKQLLNTADRLVQQLIQRRYKRSLVQLLQIVAAIMN